MDMVGCHTLELNHYISSFWGYCGKNRGDSVVKEKYKNALLKYCKLDTLAMVIIWEHWIDMVN